MEGNPGRAPRLVGVVVNCLDLTIRKSPGNEAEVTGHLSVLTEVLVDMDKSTEDFYRASPGSVRRSTWRSAGKESAMEITESVLTSVKKLLGIDEGYTHFDADIVMHINSVFSILTQMGVGPANGFSITGKDEGWSDFISGGAVLPLVKSYVGLKVRLLFDPPLSSAAVESMNRQISEFEWRLFVAAELQSGA